ncbi:MAG: biotin--[acetyl-CoA-carboxylase] ligase [Gemmatimonadales bacterium]
MARLELDGVPAAGLAARWDVPQVGLFRQLTSTLDAIHDLAAQGAPDGTVVVAEVQTAGRGRDGRTWHSPAGGVWLGTLVRPPPTTAASPGGADPGAVALRAGLLLADAVDGLLGRAAAMLKWPNDLLVGDRKLAGVLCESRWPGGAEAPQWLAVGIGVNVCNEVPPTLAPRAVALREFLPDVRRVDLLDGVVPALRRLAVGGLRLTEAECAAFAVRDWLRGRQIRQPIFGRAAGIRPDGALLVDAGPGGGTTVVRQGHVELA